MWVTSTKPLIDYYQPILPNFNYRHLYPTQAMLNLFKYETSTEHFLCFDVWFQLAVALLCFIMDI